MLDPKTSYKVSGSKYENLNVAMMWHYFLAKSQQTPLMNILFLVRENNCEFESKVLYGV